MARHSFTEKPASTQNVTLLFQIAVLAWLFLGEALAWWQIVGMVLAALGTVVVQVRRGWETSHSRGQATMGSSR